MTEGLDFALVVSISGNSTYVADFRSWTVHEFTSVSFGLGARAALWVSRGKGSFYASYADSDIWSISPEVTGNLAIGPFGGGVQANGWGVIPGGSIVGRGGIGVIDAGVSLSASIGRYVRGWELREVPENVRRWFADEDRVPRRGVRVVSFGSVGLVLS